MYDELKKQFEYYLKNQERFVNLYNGQAVVLKDFEVIGTYDNEFEAFAKTRQQHELGTFLVQLVTPGPDAYTVSIASNSVFVNV